MPKTLQLLTTVRSDDITVKMPPHRQLEWKRLVTCLENLATTRFETVQVSASSNEQVASTSGISRDATTTNTTTTTTIITTRKESIDNHSDEVNTTMEDPHFGTENPEFLDSHIVQLSLSDSYNSLPDLDMKCLKNEENQEAGLNVTVFRAINEPRKSRNKFERNNYNNDSSLDISTDTNE